MAREVTHHYIDPLAQVWLGAARQIGLRVVRTPDAYAATDGRGTLAIGSDATLDADDNLAQMIFHELCHSLVEGEDAFARPDWGMDNTGPGHDWREHACLRTQWILSHRHGLAAVFAPTTDFRAFWDQLAGDVLSDRADPSVQAAITALRRAATPPCAPALEQALAASAQIAAAAARFAQPPVSRVPAGTGLASAVASPSPLAASASSVPAGTKLANVAPPVGSVPAGTELAGGSTSPAATANDPIPAGTELASAAGRAPAGTKLAGAAASTAAPTSLLRSLWLGVVAPPALHPTGLPARPADASPATCADCAWRTSSRCRQASARIDPTWPACERFESALDCQTCGACCRAAYHSVEVSRRDPAVKAHPELILDRGSYLEVRRNGDRCAALAGGGVEAGNTTRYHCTIYDDRPRTCRDFTLGSAHCLTARRRVGLSL